MSYHSSSNNSSSSARRSTARRSTVNSALPASSILPVETEPKPMVVYTPQPTSITNKKIAPFGYHYMPDGTLMLDSVMEIIPPDLTNIKKPIAIKNIIEFDENIDGNINLPNAIVEDKVITSFSLDTSVMPTATVSRDFEVVGNVGSSFIIQVIQSGTIKYYNFETSSFADGHVGVANNLIITLTSKSHKGTIVFPSGGGTYVVNLMAYKNTKILGNKSVINKKIEKLASNATLTFKAFTANTNNYATFPTKTSTGGPGDLDDFDFDFDITNASTDAGGFGLIPTGNFKDLNLINNLWFFSTTETVDGAVAPTDSNRGFVVKVDDLTDIGVGSYISAVSAGSLVGKPVITNINTDTKELTISIAQTFANDITLTFRADGVAAIEKAIGVKMNFVFGRLDETKFHKTNKLAKTVRAGSSGTTINLNGTYGVGHNDTSAFISGVGITTATVVSVSASSSAGSMVVSTSQGALTVGTQILFANIVQVFNVFGNIRIDSYSTANQDIYLDIDKFLTPGTAS